MAFSYLVRSSLVRAGALPALMDRRRSFRFTSSGSHHNNHHLSSSTLFRFFSAQTAPKERESELLNKETAFRDGKGSKSDQSNEPDLGILLFCTLPLALSIGPEPTLGYDIAVEEKNKARFEEFNQVLLEPGLVRKIVVDQTLALVYLNNTTEAVRVIEPEQPTQKGVYLLGIKSSESFKEKLKEAQKILRLDPVPVIDVTKEYPRNPRKKIPLPMS